MEIFFYRILCSFVNTGKTIPPRAAVAQGQPCLLPTAWEKVGGQEECPAHSLEAVHRLSHTTAALRQSKASRELEHSNAYNYPQDHSEKLPSQLL